MKTHSGSSQLQHAHASARAEFEPCRLFLSCAYDRRVDRHDVFVEQNLIDKPARVSAAERTRTMRLFVLHWIAAQKFGLCGAF